MNWKNYIHSDPKILLGKPVIRGTRLAVEFLLERLSDGWTESDLLENYPVLKREHLQALYTYTYECMKDGLLFDYKKSA